MQDGIKKQYSNRADTDRRTILKLLGATGLASVGGTSAAIADDGTKYEGNFDPIEATIDDVYSAICEGEVTAREVTQLYLDRIEAYDDALNAVLTINDNALERADDLDERLAKSGPVGPLHGVPILMKDNYDTGDIPTTGGSIALKESTPPDDAFVVKQFRDAGGIIIAKTNLHELALGGETVSSLGGATRNAYDLDRIPGGSSGGTSAGIAANFAVFGTGSDTAGSIRMPAAYANLVGLRTTIGVLSRDGIIPITLSRDVSGTLTKTVADTAITLDVMAGYDPSDPITARAADKIPTKDTPLPADSYTEFLEESGLENARIGIFRDYFGIKADLESGDIENEEAAREDAAQVTDVIEQAIEDMEDLGATIIDPVSIAPLEEIRELISEATSTEGEHKRDLNAYFDDLGDDAPISSLDEFVETEQYACAIAGAVQGANESSVEGLEDRLANTRGKRTTLRDMVLETMAEKDLDAILYPVGTRTPASIGESYRGLRVNLSPAADLPAISVPAGFTQKSNMPVGIHLLGRQFNEPLLLKLAYAYEQGTDHREPPEGFGPLPNEPPEVPNPDYEVSVAIDGCD